MGPCSSSVPAAVLTANAKLLFVFQRIRATVNSQEQKRLLMDLDISMRTVDCPFTVTFYGALFREVRHPGDQLRCPGGLDPLPGCEFPSLPLNPRV